MAADTDHLVKALKAHILVCGARNWKEIRERYPDTSEATFWRCVRKAKGVLTPREKTELTPEYADLTGKRIGMLVVMEQADIWRCICECGNVIEVRGKRLLERRAPICHCQDGEVDKLNMVKGEAA